MKKGMVKQLCRISYLLFLLFAFTTVHIHAQDSTLPKSTIMIDGQSIKTKYIMRDDYLLVPARLLKHTGALVDWNDTYRSVVFQAKGKQIALPVGKTYTDEYDHTTGAWKRGSLSTKAIEFDGDVFVPLYDVVKKLDMNIKYDQELQRTFITLNISVPSKFVKRVDSSKKLVALTFDDGPDSHYTPMILDVLKEKGVPATFFVMGSKVNHLPEMTKRMVDEGHAIGNHTWNHPDLTKAWSSKVREEIQLTQEEMQKVIGKSTNLFRPPYGAITKADQVVLNEIGMKNIGWSVDTMDWSGLSADKILEIVHEQITPGGIILQHNFQDGQLLDGSVEALPRIIDELQEQGYQFVTIHTLLEQGS